MLESVADPQANLDKAFQSEKAIDGIHYPKMLREAEENNKLAAATIFSQARDVEDGHARLYKKALDNLIAQRLTKYYVCTTCGYIAEGKPPETCPICNAPRSKFKEVE